MPTRITPVFLLTFFISTYSLAQDDPALAAKAWWRALTFGDTAYLQSHSTKALTVTYSMGRVFDRKSIIEQVSKYNPSAKIGMEWSDEVVQQLTPQTAVVSHRILEKIGAAASPLRFMTALVNNGSGWKIAAAQSTKETELSTRIPVSAAGNLMDYAGNYRTPTGLTLKVVAKDSSLVLIDPSGAESLLEAIGPGIFEPPTLHVAGNVRIVFSRDASGRVTSLSRIANKVTTMQRIQR